MSRQRVLFGVVVTLMMWAPALILFVAVAVFFGWRVFVALLVATLLLGVRLATVKESPGRLRTFVEFVVFALVGMALGVLAFGGVGGIFGFTMGVVLRLAEMPTTGVFRSRKPPSDGSE
jgi:hypothetical protein